MNCKDFRTLYSDWRDDLLLDDRTRRAVEEHLEACAGCARQDRVLRRGVLALRSFRPLRASPGFGARLQARLERAGGAPDPGVPSWGGVAGALLALTALGVLALDIASESKTTTVVRNSPANTPTPVISAGVPFVTFQDPHVTVLVYAFGSRTPIPLPGRHATAFR